MICAYGLNLSKKIFPEKAEIIQGSFPVTESKYDAPSGEDILTAAYPGRLKIKRENGEILSISTHSRILTGPCSIEVVPVFFTDEMVVVTLGGC